VLPAGDGVAVHVLDEGRGLSPEIRERLFEPFVTTKDQGTGIGLVVARSLARQHGGDVLLRDRERGPGLMAVLVLPLEPAGARR
jgi:signal transduction histidine kinase